MVKKLTSHGNSMALVIDKPVLDLLHITSSTPLQISTDGESIIVSPVRSVSRAKAFRAALEKVNRKHANTLQALAR